MECVVKTVQLDTGSGKCRYRSYMFLYRRFMSGSNKYIMGHCSSDVINHIAGSLPPYLYAWRNSSPPLPPPLPLCHKPSRETDNSHRLAAIVVKSRQLVFIFVNAKLHCLWEERGGGWSLNFKRGYFVICIRVTSVKTCSKSHRSLVLLLKN